MSHDHTNGQSWASAPERVFKSQYNLETMLMLMPIHIQP